MPRILIITYAYPPVSLIAGRRPYTWAKHLAAEGFDVTIVTRHWQGFEKKQEEVDASNNTPQQETIEDGVRVIRLPFHNERYLGNLEKPIWKRLNTALANALHYSTPVNPYNFAALQQFLRGHLQNEKYDYAIVTNPPPQYLKLGYWINKTFGIPFWADFRDYLFLFDTIANTLAKAGTLRRITMQHYVRQTQKYLSAASVVSAVSKPIIDDLSLTHSYKEVLILNGFDGAPPRASTGSEPRTERFTISILGTIYPRQDSDFMLAGFADFIKDKKGFVEINFIGTGSDAAVQEKIESAIGYENLHVTGWIPRPEALAIVERSNVLYYIGWKNLKGIYSGKIFEYLGAGRNILVGPNDHDVVEELMQDTAGGKLADTPRAVAAILNSWYTEWRAKGFITYKALPEKIAAYSREEQAKKVAAILRDLITK